MIYVITGPTASHKTNTAVKLAEFLDAPIINGDAFQIYKDMDIGTSKIRKDEGGYERHYLLDIISPEETFSVMEYQKIARSCLDKLLKEHKDVVIVGGTGLYIKALLYDYEFKEEIDEEDNLESLDNEALHKMLEELDEKEAEKIHVNNRKRMLRAIRMMKRNKINKSEFLDKQNHDLVYKDVKIMFINPERSTLYHQIDERVVKMMNSGLVNEVKELLNKYNLSLTAKAGIGYKEVIDYLEGNISMIDCIALIQKRTRNYAKRQVTFFKHQFPNIEEYPSGEDLLESIAR